MCERLNIDTFPVVRKFATEVSTNILYRNGHYICVNVYVCSSSPNWSKVFFLKCCEKCVPK